MLRTTEETLQLYKARVAQTRRTSVARKSRANSRIFSILPLDHVPGPQEVLSIMLRDAGIPHQYDSFEFHPTRKYRVDIAIPPEQPVLLIEVDGNGENGHPGAHRSVTGYRKDRERDAAALLLGFTVLRVVPEQVLDGTALRWIQALLAKRKNND